MTKITKKLDFWNHNIKNERAHYLFQVSIYIRQLLSLYCILYHQFLKISPKKGHCTNLRRMTHKSDTRYKNKTVKLEKKSKQGGHISLRLLYCTINLTSRYNINRDKFAILNKLFNTKETFFDCVVGCLLVYGLLLWKYIINLVIEHCQNIFANLPLCCTYFWSISNFDLL